MKTLTSLLLILVLCVGVNHTLDAQQGRLIPGQTPCDLVSSGCAAAYSLNRRVVKSYTGNLFQVSRASDSTTTNIDQSATGLVHAATFTTFCNATTCAVHKIYDQSGSGNDLTVVGTDVPILTDSASRFYLNVNSATTGYLNNASPTSVPTTATDKTVFVVMNDSVPQVCCGMFGLAHATTDPVTPGTDYLLGLRGPVSGSLVRTYSTLYLDLEIDVTEMPYVANYTAGAGGTANGVGTVALLANYNNGAQTIGMQANGGSVQTQSYTTLGTAAQIRLGAGGDASAVAGRWYEGAILAKNITAGDRQRLNGNLLNFYQVSRMPSCGNAGRQLTPVEILGASNVQFLAGLRVLNASYIGPLATIQRASDSTTTDIGSVGCDFDTATATTFCTSTTCTVVMLYNQLLTQSFEGFYGYGTGTWENYDFCSLVSGCSGGNSTTPPTLTFSCLGSHPCLTFAADALMQSNDLVAMTPPLSSFVVAQRTGATSTYNGAMTGISGQSPFLGFGTTTNTGQYFSNFPGVTNTIADSAWHGITGVTTDSTHLTIYVESSGTTTTGTTNATTNQGMLLGSYNNSSTFALNGTMLEIVCSPAVLSSGTVTTLAAAAKAYWGY